MKKKLDFSKKVVLAVLICSLIFVAASYVLAYYGKSTNDAVTGNVLLYVTAPTIAAYMTSKTVEKTSRNKHGLDETGQPLFTSTNTNNNAQENKDSTSQG